MKEQRSAYTIQRTPEQRHVDSGRIRATIAMSVAISGLRKNVGVGWLKPGQLLLVMLGMLAVSWCDHHLAFVMWLLGGDPNSVDLQDYAFEVFGVGLWRYFSGKKKKWDLNRPLMYSLGETRLTFLRPFNNNRRVERFLEPSLLCFIGWLLRGAGLLVGDWLVLAGVCLWLTERELYKRTEAREWELGDGLIQGMGDAELLRHAGGQGEAQRGGARSDYGIPTGMDARLAEDIERRKQADGREERR